MSSGDDHILIPFGFEEDDEVVYREVLKAPGARLSDLAAAARLSRNKARAVLLHLQETGLVTRTGDRSRGYVALAPDVVIETLATRRMDEIEKARFSARRLASSMVGRASSISELVTVVEGRNTMQLHCRQFQESATQEMLGFERPPYPTETNDDTLYKAALERGVMGRFIYEPGAVSSDAHLELVRAAIAAGEKARVCRSLPMWMLIVDRKRALVPLSVAEQRAGGGLLIHSSWLLDALMRLFEALWEQAMPLPENLSALPSTHEGADLDLSERDQRILMLLSVGRSEPAIARQLGVDESTVRRRVTRLAKMFGVETRFQIGVQAARRGFL